MYFSCILLRSLPKQVFQPPHRTPYAHFLRKFLSLFSAPIPTKTDGPRFKKTGTSYANVCVPRAQKWPVTRSHNDQLNIKTSKKIQVEVCPHNAITRDFLRKCLTHTKTYANGLRSKKHRRFGPPRKCPILTCPTKLILPFVRPQWPI